MRPSPGRLVRLRWWRCIGQVVLGAFAVTWAFITPALAGIANRIANAEEVLRTTWPQIIRGRQSSPAVDQRPAHVTEGGDDDHAGQKCAHLDDGQRDGEGRGEIHEPGRGREDGP